MAKVKSANPPSTSQSFRLTALAEESPEPPLAKAILFRAPATSSVIKRPRRNLRHLQRDKDFPRVRSEDTTNATNYRIGYRMGIVLGSFSRSARKARQTSAALRQRASPPRAPAKKDSSRRPRLRPAKSPAC